MNTFLLALALACVSAFSPVQPLVHYGRGLKAASPAEASPAAGRSPAVRAQAPPPTEPQAPPPAKIDPLQAVKDAGAAVSSRDHMPGSHAWLICLAHMPGSLAARYGASGSHMASPNLALPLTLTLTLSLSLLQWLSRC